MKNIVEMKTMTSMETLREMAGGSEEFMREMITIYLEDVPDTIGKVEEALKIGDATTIKAQIHKIKPSMGFMGMMEMQELAGYIEDHAGAGNCDEKLKAMLAEFTSNLEISYRELNEQLASLRKAI